MAKKNKTPRPKKIKHPKYREHNISTLDQHRRQGKDLRPPLADFDIGFSAWLDDALPDILWAVILASHLTRDDYLSLFRKVVNAGREGLESYEDSFISHSGFSTLSDSDFEIITAPLLNRHDVKNLLSALLLFDNLPDRKHWEKHLAAPNQDECWKVLGTAVAAVFNHQSQKATDCKWLKMIYIMAIGKMKFDSRMSHRVSELTKYPNLGNQESLGAFIRSAEMIIRAPDLMPESAGKWNEAFWKECWEKTDCFLDKGASDTGAPEVSKRAFVAIYEKILEHSHSVSSGSHIDPRYDSAFGLVLYGLYLGMEMGGEARSFRAEARIILRTIVESFLTLKYLSQKDDPAVWAQYRNYGSGQSKLSFLKLINTDGIPDFVNIEDLESHANADMWMEFQDIKLGAWSNKNLRQMAEEAGVKDIYDKYYDWPSSFVHANWGAVRDTVFQTCFNPLHRFHRVPLFPRMNMGDTTMDAAKLVNLMLEELNKLYPTFKPRIKTG